jgi:hypothetical protein
VCVSVKFSKGSLGLLDSGIQAQEEATYSSIAERKDESSVYGFINFSTS